MFVYNFFLFLLRGGKSDMPVLAVLCVNIN